MQFVKTADLKPGMRLAKPIYNKMGVLLYERDTLLTMQGINSIENFGLIGIFILEPAEPVPPLSREDLEFEQFQTIYVFKLKENMDRLISLSGIRMFSEDRGSANSHGNAHSKCFRNVALCKKLLWQLAADFSIGLGRRLL